MRTAIIGAPFPKYGQGYEPPIHLAYLSAYLKQQGIQTRIIDAGLRPNAAAAVADTGQADFAAIYVDIHNVGQADELARLLKEKNPEMKAAVWGNLPTALPGRVLEENPSIDFAVMREPELTLSELIECAQSNRDPSGVPGCAVRTAKGIIVNEPRELIDNLDDLPDADRDGLTADNHYPPFIGPPEGYILTSRGCPYQCSFCSAMLQGRFRRRSPERAVEEIRRVVEKYGVRDFVFRDYTLAPKSHILGICDGLIAGGFDIRWHCLFRVDMAERTLLTAMKKAGCYEINFGIESGCQEILDRYSKSTTLEDVHRTFSLCRELGISTMANIMLGTPYDTPESIRKTIDFFCEMDPDRACITLFFPYPGTPISQFCKERGLVRTEDWSKYYTDPWHDNDYDRIMNLSPEVIAELKKGYRRLFKRYVGKHLRKSFDPRHLLKVRPLHFRQLAQYLKWW